VFNPIKPKNLNHPSIDALALLGPRAMIVIERNKSITGIAAYRQSLPPKVGRFAQARTELRTLVAAHKKLAVLSAAEIDALDAVTRIWGANLQLNTALDSEDIGITRARSPEAKLYNAQNVMETLQQNGEVELAAEALSEIEAKLSTAKAAYDATQAARVAVQVKRHELQAVAEDVHDELVKLRRVARIALGSSHHDYQRLRIRNARAGTDALDESAPETAEGASESDGTAQPSSTG
jgi:hypothetical protein